MNRKAISIFHWCSNQEIETTRQRLLEARAHKDLPLDRILSYRLAQFIFLGVWCGCGLGHIRAWPQHLPRIAPPRQRPSAVIALPSSASPGQPFVGHVPPGSQVNYLGAPLPINAQGEVLWRIPSSAKKPVILLILRPHHPPLRWSVQIIATPKKIPHSQPPSRLPIDR